MTAGVRGPTRTGFGRVLGDELRQARKQRGWTRKHLRERLAVVPLISVQTLATYELGTRSLTVERLVELCAVLQVSASELIARAVRRAACAEPTDPLPVDLHVVVRDRRPALSPLRRWAHCHLNAVPDGQPTVVHLAQAAVERMAELCGMTALDLMAALRALPSNATPTNRQGGSDVQLQRNRG